MKTRIMTWVIFLLLLFSTTQSSGGPRDRYAAISEAYWSNHLEIGDTFSGSLQFSKTIDGTEISKNDYLLNYKIIGDMSGNMWDASYNVFDDIELVIDVSISDPKDLVYYGISPINAILSDTAQIDFVGVHWEFFIISDFQNPDNGISLSISSDGKNAVYSATLNYVDAVGELDGSINTETGIVQSISYTITSNNGTIETIQYNLLTSNINYEGTTTSSTTTSSTTSSSTNLTNATISSTSEKESNDGFLPIGLTSITSSLFIISYKKKR